MPLTKFAKQKILEHGLTQTAYVPANTSVWVVFFTSVTGLEDGTLTNEVTDLARTVMPFGASSATTERTILNSSAFSITATVGGDVVTHWGLIDASTAGNLLFYDALGASRTTVAAADLDIEVSGFGIQWDQPGLVCFTKYFIDNMLDFMFVDPSATFTAPASSYFSLHTASSATGASEFVDAGYARVAAPLSAVTIVGSNAHIETNADVEWLNQQDTPAAQWSIFDASSAGNCIAFHDATDEVVPSGSGITLTSATATIEI